MTGRFQLPITDPAKFHYKFLVDTFLGVLGKGLIKADHKGIHLLIDGLRTISVYRHTNVSYDELMNSAINKHQTLFSVRLIRYTCYVDGFLCTKIARNRDNYVHAP